MNQLLSTYIIEMRRKFHKFPELSSQEFVTSNIIRQELNKMNISHISLGDTDVVAIIHGLKNSGKSVLLRADIDALPVKEENNISYCSENKGIMHACGHDGHAAMLLGAAKLLQEKRQDFSGTIKLFFQPAEETGGETKSLIRKGLLDNIDVCFAIHVDPTLKTGTVNISPGPRMAGVDDFIIRLTGPGGHGAMPHLGTDALLAGSHLVVNLQQIVSREIDPLEPVVVTIGTFHSGTKRNVLAQEAILEGNIRFFNKDLSKVFPELLERHSYYTAKLFGCQSEVNYIPSLLPTINNSDICTLALKTAEKIWGNNKCVEKSPSPTSEDFSRYLDKIPGVLCFLGTSGGTSETSYPLHHQCFNLDESALEKGSQMYADFAINYLT